MSSREHPVPPDDLLRLAELSQDRVSALEQISMLRSQVEHLEADISAIVRRMGSDGPQPKRHIRDRSREKRNMQSFLKSIKQLERTGPATPDRISADLERQPEFHSPSGIQKYVQNRKARGHRYFDFDGNAFALKEAGRRWLADMEGDQHA